MAEGSGNPESEQNKLWGPQNHGITPTREQRIQDALSDADFGKITRRSLLAAAGVGVIGAVARRLGKESGDNQQLPQSTPTETSAEPFRLTTIDAPIDPQRSFEQLMKDGVEFVADTDTGELTVTPIPDVELMKLSDIEGKIIVRRGPSSNADGQELSWEEFKTLNPQAKYKVVRMLGDEYAPGFSHLGSTYVQDSPEDIPYGIWYAIVNEERSNDGIKQFYYSDLSGNKLDESEKPFCVSANFGSILKDTPQTSSDT